MRVSLHQQWRALMHDEDNIALQLIILLLSK
jgi:hypothetical protein